MDQKKLKENHFYLSRKLIVVVGVFLLAASGLTVLTNFAINMIAASGDYSSLLSQWNHYHYQSGMHVERFAHDRNSKHLEAYQELKTSKDFLKNTIDQLFSNEPDAEAIFQTSDSKQIYPNEISGLITVFRYFNSSDKVRELNQQWNKLTEIESRQHDLVTDWYKKHHNKELVDSLNQANLKTYNNLNGRWSRVNQELMASVGNASSIVKQFGLWISVILGILLVLIGVVFTVRANKSIGRWEDMLYEKEVLLMEIHHRVKNNMAVVSGMLELESMNDGNAKKALRDSRDRIKSMSIVHEKLYQSDSFSEINLAKYMRELTEHICNTYAGTDKNITLETNFDPVRLNINQAVPVGLIVNEVLVHTIEQGLKNRKSATLRIVIQEMDGKVQIQIDGNGNSLSPEVNFIAANTTGSAIIGALTQQIDADLSVVNEQGLNLKLIFQKSDASGSGNVLF